MKSIQPKETVCEEIQIMGLSVRTNNANEMKADMAKIGTLHGTFNQQVEVDYENGANLYGLYYDYESDHAGDFSVLVGAEEGALKTTAHLEGVTIPANKYLIFSGTGEMPQVVIDVWDDIWCYFSTESSVGASFDRKPKYKRSFTMDFERYTSANSVDVYIAIL